MPAKITPPTPVAPRSTTLTAQEDPRPAVEAKLVQLALVRYRPPGEREDVVQLVVVGENNVHLLNSKNLGFSDLSTAQGIASKWLADEIFAALERKS